ncbi:MAG: DUF3823 domain-containing protein [Tannerellaceae bacterium]|nr:DUF3823 domain-containing protein [Tannerellaceae bacterium]
MACTFILTSCLNELDNFDAPDGGIKGRVLDAETNEPIPLPFQGSTGVIINMHEQNTNATKSVDFYAKDDGTFENSRMFNGEYRIVVNGPFVEKCESFVTVKGQTEIDLKATPYARIQASATATGQKVSITYKVTPANASYTVSEVYGYWNFAPGVDDGGANYAGKVTVNSLEGTIEFDLGNNDTFQSNLHKIQSNGNKIYVRIAAKTENVINYSSTITVTL